MKKPLENSRTTASVMAQAKDGKEPIEHPGKLRKTPLVIAIAAALAIPVLTYAAPGDPVGDEFRVDTVPALLQYASDVAMDADGDFVVTWISLDGSPRSYAEVHAQRYSAAGVPQGGEFGVTVITPNSNQYRNSPAIGMDADGDFVVAWESYNQDGDRSGVYARRYSAAGVPGIEFRVNNTTTGAQRFPDVALDANGDFVVVWTSYNFDSRDRGIYARRYNAAGAPKGDEFRVDTLTGSRPSVGHPQVALDDDGDFVVAWDSRIIDDTDIYAHRYNAAGMPQDSPFRVNSVTDGYQQEPTIGLDADGDFVVAWRSGINHAQRYNAAGVPQGREFPVGTTTFLSHFGPRIAMDDDGDFVIASAFGKSYDDLDIYAQRYSSAGLPQGSVFPVNTATAGRQSSHDVAIDADGDFVVAWHGDYLPGKLDYGIYARRYTSGIVPTSLIFPLKQTPNLNYTGAYTGSSITSVLDHSLKVNIEPFYAYGSTANGRGDGVIQGVSSEQVIPFPNRKADNYLVDNKRGELWRDGQAAVNIWMRQSPKQRTRKR